MILYSVCNLSKVPYTCCYGLGVFGSYFRRFCLIRKSINSLSFRFACSSPAAARTLAAQQAVTSQLQAKPE